MSELQIEFVRRLLARMERLMTPTTKSDVLEMLQRMPDDATLADIIEALWVRQKIDLGLAQLDAGESLAHEEVMQRLSRWLC